MKLNFLKFNQRNMYTVSLPVKEKLNACNLLGENRSSIRDSSNFLQI